MVNTGRDHAVTYVPRMAVQLVVGAREDLKGEEVGLEAVALVELLAAAPEIWGPAEEVQLFWAVLLSRSFLKLAFLPGSD